MCNIISEQLNASQYETALPERVIIIYGDRTKWYRTKWYGQNGMDKMVYGQNGIGQNGMDKMVQTKWYNFIFCEHLKSIEFNIYIE